MIERREKLKAQLKDKKYRDAFVSEHIDTGIPFQIRALRKQREWTQKDLSDRTGMAQERISLAENPNYSRFNLKTLKRIASAYDVALIVRFIPFSELVKWELNLSSEALEAVSFDEDPYVKETPQSFSYVGNIQLSLLPQASYSFQPTQPAETNLFKLADCRQKPSGMTEEFQKEMETPVLKLLAGGRK